MSKKLRISDKSDKELEAMIRELNGKITQARIDLQTKKITDVKLVSRLKKDLARSLTVIKERELAAATKTEEKDSE